MLVGKLVITRVLVAGLLLVALSFAAPAAVEDADETAVYAMYSGLALLMDVYHPASPNGFGVIAIPGSGWHAPLGYSAPPLKERGHYRTVASKLNDDGFTVFVINHRAAPRFRHPAALEDARRAVRYIRHNSAEYGIDPGWIAGLGNSSGGHLISLLALQDVAGDPSASDPVETHSAGL